MSVTGLAWHAAATLAAPALRLLLARRVALGKEDPARLGERRGIERVPRPPGRLVWLHAASVGEAMSALTVVDALRPSGVSVLMTTGTMNSARLVAARAPDVLHRFVPLDVPSWVGRFLAHWRPDAAAFLESELWPNLLRACRRRDVKVMLLNARMSSRSFRGWSRVPAFSRELLGGFDQVWAQGDRDAARLHALGAPRVSSPGNLKFAAAPLPADPAELARLQALLGHHPRWLAASTHEGEEAIAAAVHASLLPEFPGLVTIIVPRHPERGSALAASLNARRRGAGQDPVPGLFLADTVGELGLFYRLCPAVFVGKSLAGEGGGQNPLEPARLGCAVAAGPLMDNQLDAAAVLGAAGGLATVADAAALADWLRATLPDPAPAGARARAAADRAAGLPQAAAAALLAMAA